MNCAWAGPRAAGVPDAWAARQAPPPRARTNPNAAAAPRRTRALRILLYLYGYSYIDIAFTTYEEAPERAVPLLGRRVTYGAGRDVETPKR
ncbi:hypothetical protein NDU88_000275 [Pleurodeles waltl]|uniref:Uncharacterized protein n=1 Tax=Pleurodeles waltl TaxID=8319 RepID=A0AAV7SW13_PLEWA|nr:hypothetical protein NDU88_000275 [Pleurodeles waltl]